MTKVSETYTGGNYYKAADINKPFSAEITNATSEAMKTGNKKIVLTLKGHDKSLVLNKTNAVTLSQAYGDDISMWTGKEISVDTATVLFQGSPVKGIRVSQLTKVVQL